MADNDVINAIKFLREKTQAVEGFDSEITLTLQTLFDQLDNYESIDKEMVSKLNSIFQDSLEKKEAFNMAKAIDEGSTIVYFKSAQLFKVYKPLDVEQINEQLIDIFREYNDIYQVISKNHPQKVSIETDLTLLDNVAVFIKYVIEFMKTLGFTSFNETNISYNEIKSLVFTIDGYYVKNSKEKQKFIDNLNKYIYKQSHGVNIVNTIKIIQYSEFDKCEQFEIISLTNSLTDVDNCKYIFEPKQLPTEIITTHNNVYIYLQITTGNNN
jgi:hypothetical protein